MIRTKKAKKVLTKKEQRHLTDMGIHSILVFGKVIAEQARQKRECTEIEPCWECRIIAEKLGI